MSRAVQDTVSALSPDAPTPSMAGACGEEIRARIAVILLMHHDSAQRYLAECYASLRAQSYPISRFTTFIINNGVSKASGQCVERFAPEARCVNNEHNLGWGGGNNTGLKIALREGFDYLVMLNADTVLDKDWLMQLVNAADADANVHILQSKILLHGSGRINSLGNRIHYLGYGYCNGYGEPDQPPAPDSTIDFASGAAMLVKRAVFETIGLFREEYFMYCDDLEFCWRARVAGFNVGIATRSICHHKYVLRDRLNLFYYVERNRVVTLLILQKLGTLALMAPCLLLSELTLGVYCMTQGGGAVPLRLVRYFLRRDTWRFILTARQQVKRLRRRRDADIVKHFAGTIVFSEIDSPLLRYVINPLLALYWAVARRFIVW